MMPSARRYAFDRAPTVQELREMVGRSDIRFQAVILTMALMGVDLLTNPEKRVEAKAVQRMLSLSKDGVVLGEAEMNHVAQMYSEATAGEPQEEIRPQEISLRQAAKGPLAALGFMAGALALGIAAAYMAHLANLPHLPPVLWFVFLVGGATFVVAYDLIKMSNTSVSSETYVELAFWFSVKDIGRDYDHR